MIRKRDDIFRLHWIEGGTTLHPLHVAFRPDNRLRRCGPSTRRVAADNTTGDRYRHMGRKWEVHVRMHGKSLPGGTDTVVSSSSVQPLTNVLS